jgi:hypothetical protein
MHTKRHRSSELRKLHKTIKHKRGGVWPFSNNNNNNDNKDNNNIGSSSGDSKEIVNETSNENPTIFSSESISLQSIPKDYKSIGILHITESSGINALRSIGTDFANIFGSKGFDNGIYDHLRNITFDKVNGMLKDGQKVFNMRLDFETNPQGATIFLHFYGDLCEPIPKKNDDTKDEL